MKHLITPVLGILSSPQIFQDLPSLLHSIIFCCIIVVLVISPLGLRDLCFYAYFLGNVLRALNVVYVNWPNVGGTHFLWVVNKVLSIHAYLQQCVRTIIYSQHHWNKVIWVFHRWQKSYIYQLIDHFSSPPPYFIMIVKDEDSLIISLF